MPQFLTCVKFVAVTVTVCPKKPTRRSSKPSARMEEAEKQRPLEGESGSSD